jgi:hypothetical protein
MARAWGWTARLFIGLVLGGSGCTPQARVSVAPSVIDRGHQLRAWYVLIVQNRASGQVIEHAGVVCDEKPAIARFGVPCPEEVELSGEVWRLPDRSWCGRRDSPQSFEVAVSGARLVARLKPRTLFRGRHGECRDAHSVRVELWPPVDEEAAKSLLWMNDEYWLAPEDTPYVLESQ